MVGWLTLWVVPQKPCQSSQVAHRLNKQTDGEVRTG
eukprot:COSAG06_NODE_2216_length_7324_cov_21.971626_1_plen_35_part_10